MKANCFRCPSIFDTPPSAHPPRFCPACQAVLDAHASKKERAQQKQAMTMTRLMAVGRHIPE